MTHAALVELVVVLAVALAAAYVSRRLGVPTIVGFMVAGIVAGPGGLAFVGDADDIALLAEVGVVLLLFGVGLHFSTRELWALRRIVFGGGLIQVGATMAVATGVAIALGATTRAALVVGAIVALSSTALVVRLLEERGETDSAHGRFALGVLIGQDLAVVPILLAIPLLAGGADGLAGVAITLGEAVLVMGLAGLAARVVFPWLAARVIGVRSPELFTLLTAVSVFGTALAVGHAGASMALGAFLAGVIVSDSEYSQQIVAEIAPFREVFNSVFFVSLGMLASPAEWIATPLALGATTVGIFALKGLIVLPLAWLTLRSFWPALLASVTIAPVGEFSFVVAFEATSRGVLDADALARLLAAAVPTMIAMPFVLAVAARFARARHAAPVAESANGSDEPPASSPLSEHAVLVGYGVAGRKVSEMLDRLDVPHVVVDMNATAARALRAQGRNALYGDASREPVLERAGFRDARALVITVPDAGAARAIVATGRRMNPRASIIVRTRYALEITVLEALGADEIVIEEHETAIELAGRVLASYGAPAGAIALEKATLRRVAASSMPEAMVRGALRMWLSRVHPEEIVVAEGGSADGATLASLDLRRRTGATVLAVLRGRELLDPGEPATVLRGGDVLVVAGETNAVSAARRVLAERGGGREDRPS